MPFGFRTRVSIHDEIVQRHADPDRKHIAGKSLADEMLIQINLNLMSIKSYLLVILCAVIFLLAREVNLLG